MKQLLIVLLMIGTVLGQSTDSVQPANGFIPDAQTAIRVGVAVMTPILGKRYLDDKKPIAKLDGDVWTVRFPANKDPNVVTTGAPATIQMSRRDGHVIAAWRPQR